MIRLHSSARGETKHKTDREGEREREREKRERDQQVPASAPGVSLKQRRQKQRSHTQKHAVTDTHKGHAFITSIVTCTRVQGLGM